MKSFDYSPFSKLHIPVDVIRYLTQIHEYKGKQALYFQSTPEILEALQTVAIIQSVGSSNRIEGIKTTEKRLKELAMNKIVPLNRDEEEISGYQHVLATIHESYEYIPLSGSVILQLHRDLYRYSESSMGGVFKKADNVIEEIDENGKARVRFQPLSAFETPTAVEDLCATYNKNIVDDTIDPLLIIPVFILDFLCIHPFSDGNGRMSRLLTLLLLYQAGYMVGKYISIEKHIESTKNIYYESLNRCSAHWEEGNNEIWPFVRYLLGIILAAYRDLEDRVDIIAREKRPKSERVRDAVMSQIGLFDKKYLMDRCPDISKVTIEKVLADMKSEGLIEPVGLGRNAKWKKK